MTELKIHGTRSIPSQVRRKSFINKEFQNQESISFSNMYFMPFSNDNHNKIRNQFAHLNTNGTTHHKHNNLNSKA